MVPLLPTEAAAAAAAAAATAFTNVRSKLYCLYKTLALQQLTAIERLYRRCLLLNHFRIESITLLAGTSILENLIKRLSFIKSR